MKTEFNKLSMEAYRKVYFKGSKNTFTAVLILCQFYSK
jgi:hypothetical protein